MKRALILLAFAALPLGGCSGKAKAPDDKLAAATAAKHNPWSVDDGATEEAPDPKAKGKTKPKAEAKKAPAKDATAPANPWAKDPPPGAVPSPSPAAKDKPKAK